MEIMENIPINLHSRIFYNKLENLYRIKIPIMVGLDLASVYRKFNPNKLQKSIGLGGIEVNAMEIIAKIMNAKFLYKNQEQSLIRNETNELNLAYLRVLSKDNEIPFDNSDPIEFDTIRTPEENA